MRAALNRLAQSRGIMSESGTTAMEYALIAVLVAVVIIGALALTGTNLAALVGKVSSKVGAVADIAGGSG